MTGAGAAVSAADEHGEHSKQSADNSGHQHDGSDRRRHVDAVAAAAHHHGAFSTADDLHALGCSVQHHLEQSVNMRDSTKRVKLTRNLKKKLLSITVAVAKLPTNRTNNSYNKFND